MAIAQGHIACAELPARFCSGCGRPLAPPAPQTYGVYLYSHGGHNVVTEGAESAAAAVFAAGDRLHRDLAYVVVQSGGAGVTDWRTLVYDDAGQCFVLGDSTTDHEEFSPGGLE